MTRIYFIRHAESKLNRENRISGQTDPGLTGEGREHAGLLGERLRENGIELIYVSDLKRAKETADIINSFLGVEIVEDAELAEIHLGEWEGKTPEEINRDHSNGYEKWREKPSAVHIPDAEPIEEFRKRVDAAFKSIAEKSRDKTIAVVSHGGVLVSIMASILKADFDSVLLNTSFGNAGVTLVEYDGRFRMVYINDVTHIKGYEGRDHRPYKRKT